MRENIWNVRDYYRKLRAEGKIREIGYHKNLRDESIDTDYEVNGILITVKNYGDRTELRCFCKFHIFKNKEHPDSWCRAKSVLVLFLIDKCSKTEGD